MEPFSALAVATAACQFVDFTVKIISVTKAIHNAASDPDLEPNSHARRMTEDLTRLNQQVRNTLKQPHMQPLSSSDGAIVELGEKCNEIGTVLIKTLDRLQKKKLKSSFIAALHTVLSQGEIDALRQDLQDYRQQIQMQLVVSQREMLLATRQEHQQSLDAATNKSLSAIDGNTELLYKIYNAMNRTEPNKKVEPSNAVQSIYSQGAPGIMASTSLDHVQGILGKYSTDDISQSLLKQLHYLEINRRYERIAPAHEDTFQWILQPPRDPNLWTDFVDWLQSDTNPLYWVTGKPGAGKSTLMRYLVDHQRTVELLQKWRSTQTLILASFFFWNSGTKMQMSYEGLVRSLLHQILTQVPEMTPLVLPHRVLDGLLFGEFIFGRDAWDWSGDELLDAFKVLIRKCSTTNKIMIFIDGMDEFEGDTHELIEFVKTLEAPGIKVCASSRPWNEFSDAFGHGAHLRVETLTHDDIKKYVSSRLHKSSAFSDYEKSEPGYSTQLIEDVCNKSDGVFLWIRLVVKSLLQGLTDGESPSHLQNRLDHLPTDIEALFGKIFDSLDHWHLERASQLFQIHRASPEPLTLLEMYFADEDNVDAAFDAPIEVMPLQQKNAKAVLMNRRINACTKGLLEASTSDTQTPEHDVEVAFIHRTVKDYLDRADVWEKIQAAAPETFVCEQRLCNSYVMKLKTQGYALDQLIEFWADFVFAAGYAFEALAKDSTWRAASFEALDITFAQLSSTPVSATGTSLFAQTIQGKPGAQHLDIIDEGLCELILRVAIHVGFLKYLDQGLRYTELSVARRDSLCMEMLGRVTRGYFHVGFARGPKLKPVVSLLLEHCADPDQKHGNAKSSALKSLIGWCLRDAECQNEDAHSTIEALVRSGASAQNTRLAEYMTTTQFDCAAIEAALRDKAGVSQNDRISGPVKQIDGAKTSRFGKSRFLRLLSIKNRG